MKYDLPEEDAIFLKKRNRKKKLSPKTHKVIHESGRSTKNLWSRIITKARKASYAKGDNRHQS